MIPTRELIFECLVDPRCSYTYLLKLYKDPKTYKNRTLILCDDSNARFMDHRGVVPDNSVSLLSRGVTFGHDIYLTELSNQLVNTGRNRFVDQKDKSTYVPYIDNDVNPDTIREPRYVWFASKTHPKVLLDRETERRCHFSPSLNGVRKLGPDFDWNEENYPNLDINDYYNIPLSTHMEAFMEHVYYYHNQMEKNKARRNKELRDSY